MKINQELCIYCGACAAVCNHPPSADGTLFGKEGGSAPLRYIDGMYTIDESLCTKCGECVKICPVAGCIADDA